MNNFFFAIVLATAAAFVAPSAYSSSDYYSDPRTRVSPSKSAEGSLSRFVVVENDYDVTYGEHFKVVRLRCAFAAAQDNCRQRKYVLRRRGTEVPTVDPENESEQLSLENGYEHFEIPARKVSVGGSWVIGYLEALDVLDRDTVALVDSRYVHSPCVQSLVADPTSGVANVPQVLPDWSENPAWFEKCEEIGVELALTDEYDTGKCNQSSVNVPFHGNTDDTAMHRAEWIKFISLFFDKEGTANAYYAAEAEAHDAIKKYVNETIVAEDASRLKCVWVTSYWSGGHMIYFDKYRSSLCEDAGMTGYVGEAGLTSKVYSEIVEFHDAIRDYNVVIDESYIPDISGHTVTDYENNLGFDQPSGLTVKAKSGNGGKLLRADATLYTTSAGSTSDLKESGEVRPALLLNNLVSKVHGTFESHEDCPKYFRLANETEIYVRDADCDAITLADSEKKCVTSLKNEAEAQTPPMFLASSSFTPSATWLVVFETLAIVETLIY